MPRLRNRSTGGSVTRSSRSSARGGLSSSCHTDSTDERKAKLVLQVIKHPNTIKSRPTRSTSRDGRAVPSLKESSKTERSKTSRKPRATDKNEQLTVTAAVKSKGVVARRTRKTEPPNTQDPYAFDFFACSDDEKENIDPRGKALGKIRPALKVSKSHPEEIQKSEKTKPFCSKHVTPIFASPVAPLTGRASVQFGTIKRTNSPIGPRRPSAGPSLAELERRKSASATILLALPSIRRITHDSSVFSVGSLTPTHLLSASTPTNQVHLNSAAACKATISGPNVVLVPLEMASPDSHIVTSEHDHPPDNEEPPPEKSTQSSVTSSSRSLSEDKRDRSSECQSKDSDTSSGRRRRRQLSEKEREEAYNSWLEDFNAQLEKFESHELTVLEDEPST